MLADTDKPDYTTLRAFYGHMQRIVERWDRRLQDLGLHRRKFLVLVAVKSGSRAGAPCVGSLTTSTGLNRNTVHELVAELARQRLVTCARDPVDRRRVLVSLTPTGEDWLAMLVRGDVQDLSGSGADLVRLLQRIVPMRSTAGARAPSVSHFQLTSASQMRTGDHDSEFSNAITAADSVA